MELTTTSGGVQQRVGSRPAASGRHWRSHPSDPGLPDVCVNSEQDGLQCWTHSAVTPRARRSTTQLTLSPATSRAEFALRHASP